MTERRSEGSPAMAVFDLWSTWFLSKTGHVVVRRSLSEKLKEMLESLKLSVPNSAELSDALEQLGALDEGQSLPTNHHFNRAMLKLVTSLETSLPEVGRQMLDNVKKAFG